MFVKWKLVLFLLKIVLVSAQDICIVCAKVPQARKSFWTHPMVLLGDVGQVEPRFDPFRDSVNLSTR
jgi:hypothetical protein